MSSIDQEFTGRSATFYALEVILFFGCFGGFILYELFRLGICILTLRSKKQPLEIMKLFFLIGKSRFEEFRNRKRKDLEKDGELDDEREGETGSATEEESEEDDDDEGEGSDTEESGEEKDVKEGGDGISSTDSDDSNGSEEDDVLENPYVSNPDQHPIVQENGELFDEVDGSEKAEIDKINEEIQRDDEEEKEEEEDGFSLTEGYGMSTICFLGNFPVISTSIMLALRLFAFIFNFSFVSVSNVMFQVDNQYVWIANYQYLTCMSFSILTFYSFISTIYTAILLIVLILSHFKVLKYNHKKPFFVMAYLEYIVRLFFLTSFISAHMVTFAFWTMDVPVRIAIDEFTFSSTTLPMHGVNSVFAIIELLLLYKLTFPPGLCCWVGMYPWMYIIIVTIFVKSKFIDEYPYNGLMSNDQNVYSIFVRAILGLAWPVVYLCCGGCCLFGCRDVLCILGGKEARRRYMMMREEKKKKEEEEGRTDDNSDGDKVKEEEIEEEEESVSTTDDSQDEK